KNVPRLFSLFINRVIPPVLHPAADRFIPSRRRKPWVSETRDTPGPCPPPFWHRDIPPDRRPSAGPCSSKCSSRRSGSDRGWPPTSGRPPRRRWGWPSMCRKGGYNVRRRGFQAAALPESNRARTGRRCRSPERTHPASPADRSSAPAGKGRLLVVAPIGGVPVVRRADGEHDRIGARRADHQRFGTFVAGGGADDQPAVPRPLHRLA